MKTSKISAMKSWFIQVGLCVMFCLSTLYSQEKDTIRKQIIPFGYIEGYYVYNGDQSASGTRLPFLYSYNRPMNGISI